MAGQNACAETPLAEISMTQQEFVERGLRFLRDADDLGAYTVSSFHAAGTQMALRCYDNQPSKTHLFVTTDPASNIETAKLINAAASHLRINRAVFRWNQLPMP